VNDKDEQLRTQTLGREEGGGKQQQVFNKNLITSRGSAEKGGANQGGVGHSMGRSDCWQVVGKEEIIG